jgi:thiamine biosynthesis lipoprotein
VSNYLVEIGGELKTKGENSKGKPWKIGIDKPQEELDQKNRFQLIIKLSEKALATSGNYRKFKTDDQTGEKYVHTINPKTGYPVKSNLLSTSIITEECLDADAFATACMVMGEKEAKKMIEREAAPFPTDFEMLHMCTETLKPAIREGISRNRQYIY